jgi:MFS transporter, ACDE family, multidrug resistance protein
MAMKSRLNESLIGAGVLGIGMFLLVLFFIQSETSSTFKSNDGGKK